MKTVSVFLRVVGEVEGPVRGTLRRVATELTTFFDLALSFEQSADFADVEVFLRGGGESHNKGEVAVDGSSSVLKTLDDEMPIVVLQVRVHEGGGASNSLKRKAPEGETATAFAAYVQRICNTNIPLPKTTPSTSSTTLPPKTKAARTSNSPPLSLGANSVEKIATLVEKLVVVAESEVPRLFSIAYPGELYNVPGKLRTQIKACSDRVQIKINDAGIAFYAAKCVADEAINAAIEKLSGKRKRKVDPKESS